MLESDRDFFFAIGLEKILAIFLVDICVCEKWQVSESSSLHFCYIPERKKPILKLCEKWRSDSHLLLFLKDRFPNKKIFLHYFEISLDICLLSLNLRGEFVCKLIFKKGTAPSGRGAPWYLPGQFMTLDFVQKKKGLDAKNEHGNGKNCTEKI